MFVDFILVHREFTSLGLHMHRAQFWETHSNQCFQVTPEKHFSKRVISSLLKKNVQGCHIQSACSEADYKGWRKKTSDINSVLWHGLLRVITFSWAQSGTLFIQEWHFSGHTPQPLQRTGIYFFIKINDLNSLQNE